MISCETALHATSFSEQAPELLPSCRPRQVTNCKALDTHEASAILHVNGTTSRRLYLRAVLPPHSRIEFVLRKRMLSSKWWNPVCIPNDSWIDFLKPFFKGFNDTLPQSEDGTAKSLEQRKLRRSQSMAKIGEFDSNVRRGWSNYIDYCPGNPTQILLRLPNFGNRNRYVPYRHAPCSFFSTQNRHWVNYSRKRDGMLFI
jgi:hypothetical protein